MTVHTDQSMWSRAVSVWVLAGLFVASVVAGSAADAAGLRAGDRVLRICKQFTDGLTHADAVQLIQRADRAVRAIALRASFVVQFLPSYRAQPTTP